MTKPVELPDPTTFLDPAKTSGSGLTQSPDVPSDVGRRLVSGSAWVLAGRALTIALSLTTNGLLARLLDPAELGAYFFALTVVAFAGTIAQLGTGPTAVRLIASSLGTGERGRARMAVARTLGIVGAGVTATALVLASPLGGAVVERMKGSAALRGLLWGVALLLVAHTLEKFVGEVFRGMSSLLAATAFGGVLSSSVAVGFLLLLRGTRGSAGLGSILVLMALSYAASVAVGGLILRRRVSRLSGPGSVSTAEVLRIAWPTLLSMLLHSVVGQVDMWLVAAKRAPAEVALYGSAYRLQAMVVLPLLMLQLVASPITARLHARGETDELERVLRVTATVAAAPAVVLLGVMMLFGKPLLGLVYGGFYRAASTVLLVLAIGQVVAVCSGITGPTLIMTGHERAFTAIAAVSAVFTMAAVAAVVNRFGITGVAWASTAGLSLHNLLSLYAIRRLTGMVTRASPLLTLRIALDAVRSSRKEVPA